MQGHPRLRPVAAQVLEGLLAADGPVSAEYLAGGLGGLARDLRRPFRLPEPRAVRAPRPGPRRAHRSRTGPRRPRQRGRTCLRGSASAAGGSTAWRPSRSRRSHVRSAGQPGSRARLQPLSDPRSVPRLRRRRDRLTGMLPRAQPRRPRSLTRGLKTTDRNQRRLPPGGTTQRRSALGSRATPPVRRPWARPRVASPRRGPPRRPRPRRPAAPDRTRGPASSSPRRDLGHGHLREGLVGLTVVHLLGEHPPSRSRAAVAGVPAHPAPASANAAIAA